MANVCVPGSLMVAGICFGVPVIPKQDTVGGRDVYSVLSVTGHIWRANHKLALTEHFAILLTDIIAIITLI